MSAVLGAFPVVIRLSLPHGRLCGVRIVGAIDDVALAALAPEERAIFERLAPGRRPSWAAGRAALHAALADIGVPAEAIAATARGAPLVPPGASGSISHKQDLAVALAARTLDVVAGGEAAPMGAGDPDSSVRGGRVGGLSGIAVGVDVERDVPPRIDIGPRVLTPGEAAAVAALPEPARWRETLLRLSAKEALFKALDPFVGRTMSFQECGIDEFRADGTAAVRLLLPAHEGPFAAEVRWQTLDGHLLTTARVTMTGRSR